MSDPTPERSSIPYATAVGRPARIGLVLALIGLAVAVAIVVVTLLLLRGYTMTIGLTPPAPATLPAVSAPGAMPPVAPPPAPAPQLELSDGPARFSVHQRSSGSIPGSFGSLFVRLGNITGPSGGHVRLDVMTADRRHLAGRTVRRGDGVEFAVAGEGFVVVVVEFEKHLRREDVAHLLIRRAEDQLTDVERIGRLIDAAAASGATVIWPDADAEPPPRRDRADPGPVEEYLREVWLLSQGRIKTPDDLIREASRPASQTSGAPRLQFPDGHEVALDEWLAAAVQKQL